MSVAFYGDYNLTETVRIPFNTFSSNDPSASVTVTDLAAGDIKVYGEGVIGTPTGITVSLNVSVTGNHFAIIDLTDTNDAGFYAVGSRYAVRMEGVTIDGATVNAWIGAFSIGCTLRPTAAGRTLDVATTGEAGLDFGNVTGTLSGGEFAAGVFAADAIRAADLATGALTADAFAANALLAATFAASSLDGKGDWNTVVPDAAGVAPTATEIVNEWETQSQADPTGFHVNVLELIGTSIEVSGGNVKAVADDGTNLMRRKDIKR